MGSLDSFERLKTCLGRLPGVGRRSAERMAIRLVRGADGLLDDLVGALVEAGKSIRCCSWCGSLTKVDEDPCRLCTSPTRDGSVLCVVEDPSDIFLIERSGSFHGRYHALMGRISPMRGEGPKQIRIRSLIERVQRGGVDEVILALSTDVEGDSTASFIAELLQERKVKVSRLASGLPAGSGVTYSDPVTLARAIRGRMPMGE